MSNKLTYKTCFIDSQYRLPQSKSSSDFVIELEQNFECPAGTKCWITEVSLPTTWKTTENNFYEYLYVMIYDNTDTFLTSCCLVPIIRTSVLSSLRSSLSLVIQLRISSGEV